MNNPTDTKIRCWPSPRGTSRSSASRTACVCWLALFAAGLAGCANNRYYAASLPAELEAPLVENPQTVDLANLAMPAGDADLLAPGDMLEVNISAGLSASDNVMWLVRVDNGGMVSLPTVGPVQVAGLDEETAESAIRTTCIQRELFRNPHVTVHRKRQEMNHVLVLGAVQEPGRYPIPRHSSDLLSAIVAAGGLAEDAGADVEIRNPAGLSRQGPYRDRVADGGFDGVNPVCHTINESAQRSTPQSTRVNLVSATESPGQGYYVENGGIVRVERRDPMPLKVMGLVRRPGVYEMPVNKETRLIDAIVMAEGVSSLLADKVYIVRQLSPADEPRVIQASLSAAKTDGVSNIRLAPGDVVSVEQTPATVFLDTLKIIRFGLGASLGTVF